MKDTIKAWKEAVEDLEIEIESPFYLKQSKFPILVKNFGSNLGTIIIDMDDIDTAEELFPEKFYWSGINPNSYCEYNRDHFINTLEDWGWFGPVSKKPSWYSDKYYRRKKLLSNKTTGADGV
jgi:hypothetical protein